MARATLSGRPDAGAVACAEGAARARAAPSQPRPSSDRERRPRGRSPPLSRPRETAALTGAEVASVLLPALISPQIRSIAKALARTSKTPEKAATYALHLHALTGRLFAPGGWSAAMVRVSAEPWSTGRARPFDESTLRKAARAMSAKGAVRLAEKALETQVDRAVGAQDVTAFTDVYDQVYWTQKPSWAAPIGSLGNRILACVYFGMSFVRTSDGPLLALHVSWHKPASTLLDSLEALHADRARHRWLSAHVRVHVLDRGTQGDPALRWAWTQGIPYLTLTRGHLHWRRFKGPDAHTASGVPIFVRRDVRLADCEGTQGRATEPQVIVFPSRPEEGEENGESLGYRTAAALGKPEIETLNKVYKARWPNNENPIKGLVGVGFDRNLDRTLDPMSSRGADGAVRAAQAELNAINEQIAPLRGRPVGEVASEYLMLEKQQGKKIAKLAAKEAEQAEEAVGSKGTRADRGGEHLCKVLMLLLFNALSLLLWKSPIAAVRSLTPPRLRDLLLGCSALGVLARGRVSLYVERLPDPNDRSLQCELVRLINAERLRGPAGLVEIRIRDPALSSLTMRISTA